MISTVAEPPPPIRLRVNGQDRSLAVPRHAPLLNVLRNDLGLYGPKYGCGLGECGACTVWLDGVAARACVVPVGGIEGRAVTTLEGLAAADRPVRTAADPAPALAFANDASDRACHELHPVQQAFIDAQAAQCGYCTNGMVMQAAALLAREPRPSEARVRAELSHNLCRCGAHVQIVGAVMLAADRMLQAGR